MEQPRDPAPPLRRTCRELVSSVDASACLISRAIGELLIAVADHAATGRLRPTGHGYLIPDFPLTQEVLDRGEPRIVTLGEPGADPDEAALLRELGFGSLLMLPVIADGRPWGLVELYRTPGRPFVAADVLAAESSVASLRRALERHAAPA